MFRKSSNDMSCPMSISFNLLKINCVLSCNFLFGFNNGHNICVLQSGDNGK